MYLFIYLFLPLLGCPYNLQALHRCAQACSSWGERKLLTAVAPPVVEHRV